jgi:hypothetical protein
MKRIVLVALLSCALAASAQPSEPPAAGGLWQRLTPEQQAMLWRSLTPEQKADLWRSFRPEERRAMRERSTPADPDGAIRPGPHRGFNRGEGPPHARMAPEERERMREQIREAYRLRRERMEAERRNRRGSE